MNNKISEKTQYFRKHYFDRNDPADAIGIELPGFSLSRIYSELSNETVQKVIPELYERVSERLTQKSQGQNFTDADYSIVDYADKKHGKKEGSRKYIVVNRETPRGTRATILARFLPYGDDLYIGVSSYILGETDNRELLSRIGISTIPLALLSCPSLFLLFGIFSAFQRGFTIWEGIGNAWVSFSFTSLCCLVPIIGLLSIVWVDVIRGYSHHGNLFLALRQAFNRLPREESFNLDDVFVFFQAILPIILTSINEVFEENKIDVKPIEEFIKTVEKVTNINQTITSNFNNINSNVANQGGVSQVISQGIKKGINPLG